MKPIFSILLMSLGVSVTANAATITFFDGSQVATLVASGVTSDTISSNGYLFTYTTTNYSPAGQGRS